MPTVLRTRLRPPVGADQIGGVEVVAPLGRVHGDGDPARLRIEAGDFVTPPDVDAKVAGPLLQQSHQPGLLDEQRVHRIVIDTEEVHGHPGEDPLVHRLRRAVGTVERPVEATHVQLPDHLSDKAVRLWLGAGCRLPVEHDGTDPGHCELASQHQSVGSGSGDDDVDVVFLHLFTLR